MKNNYKEICDILRADNRFVSSEGSLLKNKIVECANKMDSGLISLLYKNDFTKNMFFTNVDEIAVFDKVKFGWVIESEDFLPDSYTHFKNNILLTDGSGNSIKKSNDVVLEFPHKDCVLEMDSTTEEEERKEVFLNETIMKNEIDCLLSPKCFCNQTKHTIDSHEYVTEFKETDNIIIKGNNLLVLYSLLPRFKNKIKLMYWDILYNTQSDKVPYNDSFKHSSWLIMMKNRLEIAKQLLKEDGVICMQCDDNEQAYLTVLCDEIFGRENRINTLVVEMASTGGLKRSHKDKHFLKTKEYILVYGKGPISLNCLYNEWNIYDVNYNIVFDENGIHSLSEDIEKLNPLYKKLSTNQYLGYKDILEYLLSHREVIFRRHTPSTWASKNLLQGEILWEDNQKTTRNQVVKVYDDEHKNFELLMRIKQGDKWGYERLEPLSWNYFDGKFKLLRGDLWKDYYKDMGNVSKEGGVKLTNGKKPERLLKDIISAFTKENDIVLDAYLGSGTTAVVAHKMNRQYIGIEQLSKHFGMAQARLNTVIQGDNTGISETVNWNNGGSFISCRLADNSQNVIDKIMNTNSENELKEIYQELKLSDFVLYRVDINKMGENEDKFNELSMDEKKKFLVGIIDKNTLYINYSDIDDFHYDLLEEDKKFTKSFYEGEVE